MTSMNWQNSALRLLLSPHACPLSPLPRQFRLFVRYRRRLGMYCRSALRHLSSGDCIAATERRSDLYLDPVADTQSASLALTIVAAFDIDCPAGSWNGAANAPVLNLILLGPLKFTFRNMAFNGVGGATNAIKVSNNGGGTLIFENCVSIIFLVSRSISSQPAHSISL